MATDWVHQLEKEHDSTRSILTSSRRVMVATLLAMTSVGAFAIGVVQEKELAFSDIGTIAPWWVGIQMLSMAVGLMYGIYWRERLPLMREVIKKANWPLITPVDVIRAATCLLMGAGLVVAILDQWEPLKALIFIPSAFILFASATLIFFDEILRKIAKTGFGKRPRIRNAVKRARVDMKNYTKTTIRTAFWYWAVGIAFIAIVWDGSLWATAIPLSLSASTFLALAKRHFAEYGYSISLEHRLVEIDGFRAEILTNPDLPDEAIRGRYRTLMGLTQLKND